MLMFCNSLHMVWLSLWESIAGGEGLRAEGVTSMQFVKAE